ncbi:MULTISPECIES: MFS transporter [unclassified Mesorhizobium]|uniref:MFS transporter n=3 Tax=Mesorhizobium TaxID=68287 RepID=UPI000FCB6D0B|nr:MULTISPECIES: MFS transporter [unclassified Mesorhizobium]RUU64934.1 MFS transporter [Mesorhizobium sp. M7A.T.Ca.TU.009.01.1.1]RUU81942.1 MFS transporter [Mesorhizobium sp. M7A.T.Ca.TU.009.01.1.2]RUV10398.1 MFS transporter [Mesorhizobium sp. M7A.T.Ca.TU.009.01.3.1]RUT85736.1 MFS transporter [Mesorhizobium sp. M7A.T.Ca.US.000.02.2.1]RUT88926.1 MFS transporter [Mesorhizobium sp. M7A.T.Ca.US.000.02.1.1]
MNASIAKLTAIRGRWALAAIFLANGFLTGSWAPQIPVFLTRLEISKFTLGLLILLFGVGAVVAMTWCGHLISRHGSRTVLRWFALCGSLGLMVVALAPNVPLAAAAMIIFGGSIGGMDVAMNANAVVVERRLSRAVMSSSHGFWSLGGFAGGGLGGFAIQHYGHLAHAAAVTVFAFAVIAVAVRHLLTEGSPQAAEHHKFALPANPLVYLIGLMALLAMISEGAVLDWAALYLRQELGADLAVAGLAYAGFSGVMAVTRFFGDGIRNRFGAVTTLRVSALVAAVGMLVAGLAPSPWLAIAAFAFCGFGIANMVPIIFSAGGNQEGMSSGTGMSVVTTIGYCGILVAPSAIGFVAEHSSFGPIFITMSGLLIIVLLMAGLAHRAEFAPAPAE